VNRLNKPYLDNNRM